MSQMMTKPISFQDLSQELLDEVIDHLRNDKRSLAACCGVSISFQRRAHKHLFHTICFKFDDQIPGYRKKRIHLFSIILQNRPHIADYVRSLRIVFFSYDESWVYEDDIFLKIMSQLNAMEEISLEDLDYAGGKIGLGTFDSGISLLKKFWQPYVQSRVMTVHLYNMTLLPLSILGNCPRLKSLTLFMVTFDSAYSGLPERPLHLDDLYYYRSPTTFWKLKNWKSPHVPEFLDMRNLTQLRCSLAGGDDDGYLLHILAEVRHSVRTLVIYMGDNDTENQCRYFNLEDMPNLTVLKLGLSLTPQYVTGKEDHILNVVEILDTLSKSNSKFRIVVIEMTESFGYRRPSTLWIERHWGSLDKAIVNLQQDLGKSYTFLICGRGLTFFDPSVRDGKEANTYIRTRLPLTFAHPLIRSRFIDLDVEQIDV